MIKSLTPAQMRILRRCSNGLRVWERGVPLDALLAELDVLCQLGLVMHDEATGFELTPMGAHCLARLDR